MLELKIHATVIAIIVFFMLFVNLKHRKEAWAPSFFTTMGILGTFIGISIGLFPFVLNPENNIADNLTPLIRGIGIAMVCSIFGISFALCSKWSQRSSKNQTTEKAHTGATADTLAEILKNIFQQQTQQTSNIYALQKSIAGDEDGSLLTQLQKIRTSFTDKQDELIKSFNAFAETMAKNNSEALIEALESVIKDFNQKITEQFGENFKHLNIAVGKLLEWQENYKQQIIDLHHEFTVCVEGIQLSKEALSTISDKSVSIVNTATTLETLLTAYQDHKTQLASHLQAFASLSTEAKQAFPIIHENIQEITHKLSSTVEKTSEEQNLILSKHNEFLTDILKSYENIEDQISKGTKTLISSIQDNIKDITSNLTSSINEATANQKLILEKQSNSIDKSMTQFDERTETIFSSVQEHIEHVVEDLNKNMDQISRRLEDQVVAIDKALEEELTKSLNSLASQLASLSNKFASDYTPLTIQLRKIVEIASATRSN